MESCQSENVGTMLLENNEKKAGQRGKKVVDIKFSQSMLVNQFGK